LIELSVSHVFYFILVPLYGNTGAAISLTLGSLVGFGSIGYSSQKNQNADILATTCVNIYYSHGTCIYFGLFPCNSYNRDPCNTRSLMTLFYIFHVLAESDVRTSLDLLPDSMGKTIN
jgi:hypothetical protein